MRAKGFVVSILILFPAAVAAQHVTSSTIRQAITPAELEQHARVITSQVRPSGSVGENAAIDYIASTLHDAGVPVVVHEFSAYTSDPVSATVNVVGTGFSPEAITASFSGSVENVVGRVVDVGALDALPALEVGTGERLVLPAGLEISLPDLRDAIVLVDGQPRNIPVLVLAELGAAGVVFANPEERLNELIVTSTWGTPSLRNYHRVPKTPVAQIKRSDAVRLRSMMRGTSLMLRMSTRVDTGWRTLRVPVARIEPTGQSDASYVLLGGHIDAWHYGGTDEGASNAAMLAMAIAFHRERTNLQRGLVVAWWPGHSNARYGGSTWFADQFFEELRDRAVAYLNIDGVGQRGAKRFSVTSTQSLRELGLSVVRTRTGMSVSASRPGRNSDQSFNGIGMPLLQFNHTRLSEDGGYWWWHTPDDTLDKIDFDVLDTDTDLYIDAITQLTTDVQLPLDIVGQFRFVTEALQGRQIQSGANFDLSVAIERSRDLTQLASRLMSLETKLADDDLVRILRPIHRVLYTPLDAFHPDPGRSLGVFPGLAAVEIVQSGDRGSDRFHYAVTTLTRERNRIHDALSETERLIRQLLPT